MMNKLKYMEINGKISLFLCISTRYILLKLNNIKIHQTIIIEFTEISSKRFQYLFSFQSDFVKRYTLKIFYAIHR